VPLILAGRYAFLILSRVDQREAAMSMTNANSSYSRYIIKSFKHDGSLHRVWLENWLVPKERLHPKHAEQQVWVLLNDHTTIVEADGKEWISRVPAVSFFLPNHWFNVVALIEDKGIRYYCNLASPPYQYGDVLTYIDYDLDIVVLPDRSVHELDREEYQRHKTEYRYGASVEAEIEVGLELLKSTIATMGFPFGDDEVYGYYEQWKQTNAEGESEER
jgi:protein associated with RNAse G/E